MVGRLVLWSAVVLLLVRGAADVLATTPAPRPVAAARVQLAAAWPDDAARAFAADFTRAYLSYSPRHARRYTREVGPFVTPGVMGMLPRFAQQGSRQAVQQATIARTARVDGSHALVTVAATVVGRGVQTLYLTVPVGRDAAGGLVVYDLPSFTAAPARAAVDAPELEALAAGERAGVEDVVTRFLRAFLAGRGDELEYLVPAGTRVPALSRAFGLVGVDAVDQLGPARGRARWVVATVRARDVQTRAVFPLRYRLRLVKADRWYVAAVNTTPKEG